MKSLLVSCVFLLLVPIIVNSSPVPDTGQIECYDDVGNEINPCPAPGEPFYGQDANYINPQSYTKLDANGNALPDDAPWPWTMVRDNVTGLIWQTNTAPGTYNWEQALSYCENITLGGYSDWRLPTIKELSILVDSSVLPHRPLVNAIYFPGIGTSGYWSSTTTCDPINHAWYVYFGDGFMYMHDKSSYYYVLAVRGEQYGPFGNYIDNDNGTVTDTDSGLMWQQDTAPDAYTWQQALSYCENLSLAGYSDWRLPNRNELQSLVDYACHVPSINTTYFPNTLSHNYWSSTTYDDSSFAWMVHFDYGVIVKTYKPIFFLFVRAVRGGLCGSFGDADGDTICDNVDNCMDDYNPLQMDCDNDGTGDICDPDTTDPDGDGVDVACDNCPDVYNPNQEDGDEDGIADACDPCPNDAENDIDGDEICSAIDNCPNVYNPDQLDSYPPQGNGIGDACECEGDFDCDGDVDGSDAAKFKGDFGRTLLNEPCYNCNGDFSCDYDVDGSDAALFKQDFGRNASNNPCPACEITGAGCNY